MSFFYEHPVYQIMEKSKIVLAQHKMIATSKAASLTYVNGSVLQVA